MSRYELEFDPEEYRPRRRSRPPGGLLVQVLRVVFALGAVAAVAGSVYLGLRQSASVTDDSGIPLIKAEQGPFKARPEQPGGMDVPNQDKVVFDRLDPEAARPVVERLLPPPETPLPRPVSPPPPPAPPPAPVPAAASAPAPTSAAPPSPPSAPAMANTDLPGGARPTPNPASAMAAALPASPLAPETGGQGKPPVAPSALPSATVLRPAPVMPLSAVPVPKVAPPPVSPPAAPPKAVTPPVPAPATVSAGGVLLQLASVRSEAEAREEWRRLSSHYHELLGGFTPSVVKVDLPEKGVYFRLRVGPLDEAHAHSVCEQLKSQNVGCQLARH